MKVLLTGASGFVGSHCLEILLREGHEVVTVVRSDQKGQNIVQAFPSSHEAQLSYAVVKDITVKGAFDNAVQIKAFDAVIHVASPFHYHPVDVQRDLIDPAVNGTVNLLEAVHAHAPTVKRVVVTSSVSAVINLKNPPKVYEEHHFNPITIEEAHENGVQAYRASKTFAERAAWEFVRSHREETTGIGFSLACINPPLILGPVAPWLESMDAINTSNERLRDLVQGKWKEELPPTASWYWVDVRDVALAHVRAMERSEAGGRRFFVTEGRMSNAEIAKVAVSEFPELKDKVPQTLTDDTPPDLWDIDTEPSKEVLSIKYHGLRDCVVQSLKSMGLSLKL